MNSPGASGSDRFYAPSLWWLNPIFALPAMVVPLIFVTYWMADSIFVLEWKCRKYTNLDDLYQVAMFVATFCVAGAAVQLVGRRKVVREPVDMPAILPALTSCFNAGVFLTVAGYLVWAVVAVVRGFRPGLLKGILELDGGTVYQVKNVYFKTVPGITTATQFGMGCVGLGAWIAECTGSMRVRRKLRLLLLLGALRAIFLAERLALIEVAFPWIVVKCRFAMTRSAPHSTRRRMLVLAPLFAIPVLLLFFAGSEYFRSWGTWYQYTTELTLLEFSAVRLTGYYVTAINNAVVYIHALGTVAAPLFTFDWFWNFPGVRTFFDLSPVVHTQMQYGFALTELANPEMNNISGLLTPVLDFGAHGAVMYWAATGALASFLYRHFVEGKISGILLYPFFYVGLTEVARVGYWTSGRAFPSWVLLVMCIFIAHDVGSRVHTAVRFNAAAQGS